MHNAKPVVKEEMRQEHKDMVQVSPMNDKNMLNGD
jgi:hypothetical protein